MCIIYSPTRPRRGHSRVEEGKGKGRGARDTEIRGGDDAVS